MRQFFTTPPLVSLKFPHVPLEVGEWRLRSKERSVGLIDRAISFQDFYLCDHNPPTSQTDGRTDRQTDTMQSQYRAMHIVHRAVKKLTGEQILQRIILLQRAAITKSYRRASQRLCEMFGRTARSSGSTVTTRLPLKIAVGVSDRDKHNG